MRIKLLFIGLCTFLLMGCTYISSLYSEHSDRLNHACKSCGYNTFTDSTLENNYNHWSNQITLTLVECDNSSIISLYDGYHTTDKWGNKIIKEEDMIFCERNGELI